MANIKFVNGGETYVVEVGIDIINCESTLGAIVLKLPPITSAGISYSLTINDTGGVAETNNIILGVMVSFFTVFFNRIIPFKYFGEGGIVANVIHSLTFGLVALFFCYPLIEWWWIFPLIFISGFYNKFLDSKL